MTDFPAERFYVGASVLIGSSAAGELQAAVIRSVRTHNANLLVRFEGADDRDSGQALTGKFVFVDAGEARPLGEDEYYFHELVGLEVETVGGLAVGRVTSTIETGSADVIVVTTPGGRDHLMPLIKDIVKQVDLEAGRLTIDPMPGLLD
jgi:16S rRNA processing protein RimM